MTRLARKRPSAAMVVGCVALSFALAGSAVAGTDAVTSKLDKKEKKQVKKLAKKQANKQIRKKESGLRVEHARTAGHADTAGHANTATNATNAVNAQNAAAIGGLVGHKLFTKIPSGTGPTTVLNQSGLVVTAACPGGNLDLDATTTVNNSYFASNVNDNGTANGIRESDFDVGAAVDVLGGESRGAGTFTYSQPGVNGPIVQAMFGADDTNTLGTFDGCIVVGTAFNG